MYSCRMRSQKETYVYVILERPHDSDSAESKGFIKIGRSVDVDKRRTQMQLCTPRDLKVLRSYGPFENKVAKKVEKDMHKLCEEHHVRGEWFCREGEELVIKAMEEDEIMSVFEKQDIQNELKTMLEKAWVLSTIDLIVTDHKGQDHTLDLALHTGEFVFGRITIGSLSNVILPGIKEIQCKSRYEIEHIVSLAIEMQDKHCRSRVVMQDKRMVSQTERMVA